jgi:hypothetical protein
MELVTVMLSLDEKDRKAFAEAKEHTASNNSSYLYRPNISAT